MEIVEAFIGEIKRRNGRSLSMPRYANGYKYCSRCSVYIKTEKLRCPRCGLKMRAKSRRYKKEERVRRIQAADEL